jgi:hypothetical protein
MHGAAMKRSSISLVILSVFLSCAAYAQQEESYDYYSSNRTMVRNGVQAVLMCNGLFTSNRTLEQVFAQELAYLNSDGLYGAVGTVDGGEYVVDRDNKAVAIGGPTTGPTIRAAFRKGIGCVVMAPDQTFDDIDSLPSLDLPYPAMDPATTPWPNGDLVENRSLPANIDASALQGASDWAFDRDTPEQDTDAPLGFEWEPAVENPQNDPRNAITLRNALNMSSGLYPVDSSSMEYATGSGLAYWAGASSIRGMRNRGLIREPGTFWDYENYDTLLAVYAMKQALGSDKVYQEFPRRALLDKIGMRNTLVSADRFHNFILSSQVYTTARDLARFGLLYQQNGVWDGERLISEDWIDFVRTPAASTRDRGNFYGGQWWLVPDDRTDVPKSAYSTSGNRGQYVIVVPTHDLVIVRRGLDYGEQGFNRWDLTREVLKAIGTDQAISQQNN